MTPADRTRALLGVTLEEMRARHERGKARGKGIAKMRALCEERDRIRQKAYESFSMSVSEAFLSTLRA